MRCRSWSLNSSSSSWSPVGDQCDHPIEAVVVVLVVVVVDVVVPLVISVTQELIIRYWSFPEMTIIHWTCGQLEEFNWTALDQHNTTGSLGTWSMSSSYLANSNCQWRSVCQFTLSCSCDFRSMWEASRTCKSNVCSERGLSLRW